MYSTDKKLEYILNNLIKYFQHSNYNIKTTCKNDIEIIGFISNSKLNEEGHIEIKLNNELIGRLRFVFIDCSNVIFSEHEIFDNLAMDQIFDIIQYKKYTRIDYDI